MKLHPVKNPTCGCKADRTWETAVQERRITKPPLHTTAVRKRAKQIFHYRAADQAHFWHWSDQDVIII